MSPKFPVFTSKELIKILEKYNWEVVRQKGSHIIMIKKGEIVTLSIPNHKEISIGTLKSILKSAKLDIDNIL